MKEGAEAAVARGAEQRSLPPSASQQGAWVTAALRSRSVWLLEPHLKLPPDVDLPRKEGTLDEAPPCS